MVRNLRHVYRRAVAAALAVLPAAAAAKADDASGVASSRMSYSRFLEYLDMGRVQKVYFKAHSCDWRPVCRLVITALCF